MHSIGLQEYRYGGRCKLTLQGTSDGLGHCLQGASPCARLLCPEAAGTSLFPVNLQESLHQSEDSSAVRKCWPPGGSSATGAWAQDAQTRTARSPLVCLVLSEPPFSSEITRHPAVRFGLTRLAASSQLGGGTPSAPNSNILRSPGRCLSGSSGGMSSGPFAHLPSRVWPGDDAGLSEGNDTEADVTRLIVVDEERLGAASAATGSGAAAEQQQQQQQQAEASTSYAVDSLEQFKLLLSGGVAGAFSKTCTAPLARLTILYQVSAGG